MVDFQKLKAQKKKEKIIDPAEIFRRLPKPVGINDLYASQTEVLRAWFTRRDQDRDVVLKLHTGGGKTLVGLLIAQSSLNELGEPVLYLVPTTQLVNQTIEKANAHGVPAVPYEKSQPLNDRFVNGNALMVATYSALFNGRSKFGVRGIGQPQKASTIICDDSHAAFGYVRSAFTLEVKGGEDRSRFEAVAGLFRRAFVDADKVGTFDDVLRGADYAILEVPYWAWHEQLGAVRELLKSDAEQYGLVWPLLRDSLRSCHALISREAFTITPILPLVNLFPTFADARRRIYMSATIVDDSEIIRTFDVNPDSLKGALTSRSLAGISERMILIPNLMAFNFDIPDAVRKIAKKASQRKLGAVVLVPSVKAATAWAETATVAQGSRDVERLVKELQDREIFGPVVFASRYDGIDLPGDSCRLLIMDGLPIGTSTYELFRASTLYGGVTITRLIAQRIEQGMGRGARGSGDSCVVILVGRDLAAWIAKGTNFRFLTSATKAQIGMGVEISKQVADPKDLVATIKRSFDRDREWREYHADALAEFVDEETRDDAPSLQASVERKAFGLWQGGYHERAIAKIEKELAEANLFDNRTRGWLKQLAARIASSWGNATLAEDLQRDAYAENQNLMRPKVRPPYRPLAVPGQQERAIVRLIGEYRHRRGLLEHYEGAVANLHPSASSNQFEQALADLAILIGLASDRHDVHGEGPDVLWLLPSKVGFVIEAKSRKRNKKQLTKEDHGQLLVAAEWFAKNYSEWRCVRVSVHPNNQATKAAGATESYALTYEKLAALVSDARALLTFLCDSQLAEADLIAECTRLLMKSNIRADRLAETYLQRFVEPA